MSDDVLPVAYTDIEAAAMRLEGKSLRTPVLMSSRLNASTSAEIFFKCENLQRGGAFKFRGAYNALACLSAQQRSGGVVTFSSGNHALAISLAARIFQIKATIVMPEDAPRTKLEGVREQGADVVLYQRGRDDRHEIALRYVTDRNATLIPPFDHGDVIAGQGTVAKELLEEVGALDILIVPVGGGGLISGCALSAHALSPRCKVYGAEPATGNDAQLSLRSGQLVSIPFPNTIADGAQTQKLGDLTFAIMRRHVTDVLTASDEQLKAQMRVLAKDLKIVVEPTGCLSAAVAMNSELDLRGKRVGVILSGGNVDLDLYAAFLKAGTS